MLDKLTSKPDLVLQITKNFSEIKNSALLQCITSTGNLEERTECKTYMDCIYIQKSCIWAEAQGRHQGWQKCRTQGRKAGLVGMWGPHWG